MSRSYRKHFWFPTEGDKRNKKWFNRKLRHQCVGSGGDFKRKNDSRDIHSFFLHYSGEEAFVQENLPYLMEGQTEWDLRKIWRKYYMSK